MSLIPGHFQQLIVKQEQTTAVVHLSVLWKRLDFVLFPFVHYLAMPYTCYARKTKIITNQEFRRSCTVCVHNDIKCTQNFPPLDCST